MRPVLLILALAACNGGDDASSDSAVEDSGTTEDSGVEDAAPTASIEAPVATAALTAGTIDLEGTVSDVEDDTETLTASWNSSIDGALASPTPDSAGVVDVSVTLSAGSHTLTLSVTDSSDQTTDVTIDIIVEVANTAPTTPIIQLVPSTPVEGTDDLYCQIVTPSTDADLDAITYDFTWDIDTTAFTGTTYQVQHAGDQIAASGTLVGEVWTCTATASDGIETSAAATASVTIAAASCGPTDTFPNCGGINTDDVTYNDGSSTGNRPVGFKHLASSAMDIQRVEVFSGEGTQSNRVAIWSDNNGEPGAELAGASFRMESAVGWQGASFTDAASIGAGETYWVVWSQQNGAQSSIQATGTDIEYKSSGDGGVTWTQSYFGPWKLKVFCCE